MNIYLINMNGRLYDPAIAMFLNPDNYVQDPESSQNYNRYTYCLNNPLKYSDPSGMLPVPTSFNNSGYDSSLGNAWLNNYYTDWNNQYGGATIGGGDDWDTWMAAVHSGYIGNYSDFYDDTEAQKKSPTYNGTVVVQTGWMDWYSQVNSKDGSYKGPIQYINSTPIYSTIPVDKAPGAFSSGFWDPSLNASKFNQSVSFGGLMLTAGKGISESQINSGIKALQNSGKASLPYFSKGGKFLGWISVGSNFIEFAGKPTWGNGVKVSLDVATIYVPYAGWAYGLVDLGFSAFTNASLTDRIGSGIDNFLNKNGGVMVPWNVGYIWISNSGDK